MRERDTIAWWAWGAWILGAAAYLGSFVWALTVLPDRVAAHVGLDGVDRWGSITEHVVMSVIVGVVFLPMPWFFLMTARPPGTWLNMPHKDYWFATPERTAVMRRRLFEDALIFSALNLALLAVVVQVGVVLSTRDPQAGGGALLPVSLGVYLVATAVWVIHFYRRYKPPPEESS